MPIYVFENPDTGETVEVVQKMTDKHSHADENGLEWDRVWSPSNLDTTGTINPDSYKSFEEATKNKNYTLGEMWDRSAELSEERASKHGEDKVKKRWLKSYSKNRKGTKYSEHGPISSGDIPTVQFED